MKIAIAACAFAACMPYAVDSTSTSSLGSGDDHDELAMPARDAAQAVIEKLGARGFTVIDARPTPAGYYMKLAGNRDYSGTATIGSVFYAWLDDHGSSTTVHILGKPTIDHVESCPSADGKSPCKTQRVYSRFGITGLEEAQVIHGVFAELALDGFEGIARTALASAPRPIASAAHPTELGHLTLHGCGRP